MAEENNLKQEIKQNEFSSKKAMKFSEVIRFLTFSIMFVVIIINQINTQNAYEISEGLTQSLGNCNPSNISSSNDVKNWIEYIFFPTILDRTFYFDWNMSDYTSLNIMNRVVTPVRLVQKRVARVPNTNSRTKNFAPTKWATDYLYAYKDNGNLENKQSFEPANLNSSLTVPDNIKYSMFNYNSNIGIGNSGGYYFTIDLKATDTYESITDFYSNVNWIDNSTGVIYVDFIVYNSHLEMVSYVNYLFTFYSCGLVESSFSVSSARFDYYSNTSDIIRAVFEVLYLIFLIFYTIMTLQVIKVDILSESINVENSGIISKYNKLLMYLQGIKKHYTNLWNLLDSASLILSYIGLVYWLVIANNKIVKKTTRTFDSAFIDDVIQLKLNVGSYVIISSINILLIFIRLLKYLGKFEKINLMQRTLEKGKTEIGYFFVLLFGVFISFVVFGYIVFGSIHKQFSELGLAFAQCLVLLFGNLNVIKDILDLDFAMGALFLVLFTLFLNFIMANMFIAIINNAYRNEYKIMQDYKANLKKVDKKHFFYMIKDWFKHLKLWIFSCFSKREAVINKYSSRDQDIGKIDEEDEVIRAENYDLEYNEAMKWGEKFDKEILTDKEKNLKISQQTLNFSKKIWKALIFIIFAILYTIVIIQQAGIETKYDLSTSVKAKIESVITSNHLDLAEIYDYKDYAIWLSESFQNIFTLSTAYNLEGNYLIGQYLAGDNQCSNQGTIRMTARFVKTVNNPSWLFELVNPQKRLVEFSPHSSQSQNEDQGIARVNPLNTGCNYTYQSTGGFSELGGYVFFFSQKPSVFNTQMYYLLEQTNLLNESTNSFVIEFVLYNGDLNYFTYTSYICQTLSGGGIFSTFYIWPMKLKNYFTPSDKLRAFLEIVVVLLLIFHIYVTVSTLKTKFKNYDDWSLRFYEILTTKQREKRRLAKPEWLRKINNILTSYEILDIISYILTIVCIIYWLIYISTDLALNFVLPTIDPLFHDKFTAQAVILQTYLNISSVNILIIYFRVMNYVTVNKALRFLENTMKIAMVDILYFLIMLIVILLGFVFMAYLSFGSTLYNYRDIQTSFVTCFSTMVGQFNYDELLTANSFMTYFYFFPFMLIFVFVLLNIFIAILERSYTQVKQEASEEEIENNVTIIESLIIFLASKIRKLITRAQHEQEHQKDIKDLAVCVFNRIDMGIDDEDDPHTWALKQTEEILLERQKRLEIKEPLESVFRIRKQNVIEGGNFFFEKQNDIDKEFEARIDYWDYLRIGFISFQTQEQKIKLKIEELTKSNKLAYDEYKEIENEKEKIMLDIQPIEISIMKIKKENEELRKQIELSGKQNE